MNKESDSSSTELEVSTTTASRTDSDQRIPDNFEYVRSPALFRKQSRKSMLHTESDCNKFKLFLQHGVEPKCCIECGGASSAVLQSGVAMAECHSWRSSIKNECNSLKAENVHNSVAELRIKDEKEDDENTEQSTTDTQSDMFWNACENRFEKGWHNSIMQRPDNYSKMSSPESTAEGVHSVSVSNKDHIVDLDSSTVSNSEMKLFFGINQYSEDERTPESRYHKSTESSLSTSHKFHDDSYPSNASVSASESNVGISVTMQNRPSDVESQKYDSNPKYVLLGIWHSTKIFPIFCCYMLYLVYTVICCAFDLIPSFRFVVAVVQILLNIGDGNAEDQVVAGKIAEQVDNFLIPPSSDQSKVENCLQNENLQSENSTTTNVTVDKLSCAVKSPVEQNETNCSVVSPENSGEFTLNLCHPSYTKSSEIDSSISQTTLTSPLILSSFSPNTLNENENSKEMHDGFKLEISDAWKHPDFGDDSSDYSSPTLSQLQQETTIRSLENPDSERIIGRLTSTETIKRSRRISDDASSLRESFDSAGPARSCAKDSTRTKSGEEASEKPHQNGKLVSSDLERPHELLSTSQAWRFSDSSEGRSKKEALSFQATTSRGRFEDELQPMEIHLVSNEIHSEDLCVNSASTIESKISDSSTSHKLSCELSDLNLNGGECSTSSLWNIECHHVSTAESFGESSATGNNDNDLAGQVQSRNVLGDKQCGVNSKACSVSLQYDKSDPSMREGSVLTCCLESISVDENPSSLNSIVNNIMITADSCCENSRLAKSENSTFNISKNERCITKSISETTDEVAEKTCSLSAGNSHQCRIASKKCSMSLSTGGMKSSEDTWTRQCSESYADLASGSSWLPELRKEEPWDTLLTGASSCKSSKSVENNNVGRDHQKLVSLTTKYNRRPRDTALPVRTAFNSDEKQASIDRRKLSVNTPLATKQSQSPSRSTSTGKIPALSSIDTECCTLMSRLQISVRSRQKDAKNSKLMETARTEDETTISCLTNAHPDTTGQMSPASHSVSISGSIRDAHSMFLQKAGSNSKSTSGFKEKLTHLHTPVDMNKPHQRGVHSCHDWLTYTLTSKSHNDESQMSHSLSPEQSILSNDLSICSTRLSKLDVNLHNFVERNSRTYEELEEHDSSHGSDNDISFATTSAAVSGAKQGKQSQCHQLKFNSCFAVRGVRGYRHSRLRTTFMSCKRQHKKTKIASIKSIDKNLQRGEAYAEKTTIKHKQATVKHKTALHTMSQSQESKPYAFSKSISRLSIRSLNPFQNSYRETRASLLRQKCIARKIERQNRTR